MYFSQLLLNIIQKFNGERSAMASFYLLKGKKSGQTIQDVTYFNLHRFFSIYPKLTQEEYKQQLFKLQQNNWIEEEDSLLRISHKGLKQLTGYTEPLFNGWELRGNEKLFWSRLELVVQTLSYFNKNETRFIPNQKDYSVHQFVKDYLRGRDYKSSTFQKDFKNQLEHLLQIAELQEIHRILLVYRMSGYHISGLTWEQLALECGESIIDMKLQFVEALHIVLDNINQESHPDLIGLTKEIFVHSPLTQSALKTEQLLKEGYSIQDIAALRSLKANTIEDHLIEIAAADRSLSLTSFILNDQIKKVLEFSNKHQTKKLRLIRENIPELSYFQIRLALAKGEKENG
ncbi:helix-turn-helix domain-containing protein [Psychrobacillus sp. FSL K6-2684]|uniref:helix-turn-helix domain-containing protein n=1 Tax=unclassified Psychrobacillus TaxID=2636677 RepID=UPI00124437F5|nr:helix-turn-helix domain-containing protein [Psychrobacillus sp. AK 1817]